MHVTGYSISEIFSKLILIAHLKQLPTFPFAYKQYIQEFTVSRYFPSGQTKEKYGNDLNFSIQLLQCIEAKL